MNANIAKVQSLIENAFTSAIEKLAKDESGNFISDLYVQADAESGELQIYDDEEHLIEKIVIFDCTCKIPILVFIHLLWIWNILCFQIFYFEQKTAL